MSTATHQPDAITPAIAPVSPVSPEELAAVRAAFAEALARSPDLRFQPMRVYFDEAHFVSQYVMSGTVEGKPYRCEGVDIFLVRDGLVVRKDTYADWITYERQVGPPAR